MIPIIKNWIMVKWKVAGVRTCAPETIFIFFSPYQCMYNLEVYSKQNIFPILIWKWVLRLVWPFSRQNTVNAILRSKSADFVHFFFHCSALKTYLLRTKDTHLRTTWSIFSTIWWKLHQNPMFCFTAILW